MIQMFDAVANYHSVKPEIDEAIAKVVESGHYILGEAVEKFEEEVAKYLGVKYAIGVASGTDALYLALRALEPVPPIQTSSYTFIASAEAICRYDSEGGSLELADINLDTYCMEPTAVVGTYIPVHLFGHPCNMDEYLFKKNLVVEDCAQAFGAEYKGKKVGTLGKCGCLSFYPTKNLGCYGDGGMVVTNDKAVAQRIRCLRNHGTLPNNKYVTVEHGLNSRLDAIQAVVLSVKLKYIDQSIKRRREIATLYNDLLLDCNDIVVPYESVDVRHSWNYYTIRCRDSRDRLRHKLTQKGIETIVYFPYPMHRMPVFNRQFDAKKFPNSDIAAASCLSLPMYPELAETQVEYIAKCIKEFYCS